MSANTPARGAIKIRTDVSILKQPNGDVHVKAYRSNRWRQAPDPNIACRRPRIRGVGRYRSGERARRHWGALKEKAECGWNRYRHARRLSGLDLARM